MSSLVSIRPRGPLASPGPDAPRLYVETHGCQMNVADTELIRSELARGGFAVTEEPGAADVILINTCAVREKAEEKVFARARELGAHKQRRPDVVLGITGCMAEHLRDSILERAPHVDVVAGPDAYRRLLATVNEQRSGRRSATVDVALDREETYSGLDAAPGGDGVSGFVTIQRGCDKFCTFCVVPFTRGRERGAAPGEVLRQVRSLAALGYREVTLLGQTVNSYRHESTTFARLVRAVAAIEGIERVRFTSPYPIDFTDDVIDVIASVPEVARHVHLPLQSASDRVLSIMKRGYDFAAFMGIVTRLRAACPEIALTTDLMTGMAGETEDDHQETMRALADIRFDSAFMFAYSQRSGTYAAKKLADDVAEDVKKRRLADMVAVQRQISKEVYARQVGRTETVLFHQPSRRNPDELMGRTSGFKAVIVSRGDHVPGDIARVVIERSTSATLFGRVV